jgi:hypothetical protein
MQNYVQYSLKHVYNALFAVKPERKYILQSAEVLKQPY